MKHKLLKTLFAILFIISGIVANGQITVHGVIVDELSNEPLPGAGITVRSVNAVTVSQIDGSFRLNLPEGTHRLEISYVGFLTKELEVSQTGDLGRIKLEADALELEGVMIVASYARDRETPVALSTIKPEIIMEKLGSKEFPEILRSTPSVYATKSGGGYGDSRINLRGFDSNNIGVLINGVPINDMESGRVYWSNWAGLSDVTRTMQVQRGMGASKLALSSVGGTINIITKSTDAEKGGSIYTGFGNDGYNKYSLTLSTGLMDNGWAVTISAATSFADGYVDGTNYRAYSYFANVSKILNKKHRLSFQVFGAPQWHNQRGNQHKISTYRNANPDMPFYVKNGTKFNSDYGYRNGKVYGAGYGYNEYHKPQISLNHFWDINETSSLTTAVYASISSGGGRRLDGAQKNLMAWDYKADKPTAGADAFLTPEGLWDFDRAIELNSKSLDGSQIIVSNSVNSHKWFGLLSSYKKSLGNFNITGGIDARYYIGEHTKKIVDLLGGKYYFDNNNVNRPNNTPLTVGDKFEYNNDGIVSWLGLFAQAEYVKDQYSAFLSASVSSNNYKRKDYFLYKEGEQLSDWESYVPISVKGGFNYNINDQHNVFINAGYFTRAPYYNIVYPNYTNDPNKDAKMENVISGELGYGFTSRIFKAKLNGYITNWRDKGTRKKIGDTYANIPGLNALHSGVELEVEFNPFPKLFVTGMWSLGEWVWQDDVTFKLFDENQNLLGEYNAYIKDVHVGNSAQHTAALGVNYEIFKDIKIGADLNYYGKNFAEFDPTERISPDKSGIDSWQLPDATILSINARWKFKLGNFDATLYGNVDNLLNTEYIADATEGSNHDMHTSRVYYGFGRTWTAGLRINF